jgi:hypothetical protein
MSTRSKCSAASGVVWSKRLSRWLEDGSITVNRNLSAGGKRHRFPDHPDKETMWDFMFSIEH